MVIAKTLLKLRAITGDTPAKMLFDVNNTLCEDNKAGLFVTVWLGIFSLSTGELSFANAGHEYPAVMHKDGDFELIKGDNMPPLATVRDIEYVTDTIALGADDELFLYTDGVPDAKNAEGERFGTDRMVEMLNRYKDQPTEELLKSLKSEIDSFRGSVDPFDDITMLGFHFNG
jgi:sigma-B regulation protein RsbU (phosphoserine phosphatase)